MTEKNTVDERKDRLSNEVLELRWPAGGGHFFVSRRDERVRFGPLHMRARVKLADGRVLNIDSSLLSVTAPEMVQDMPTPLGHARGMRAEIKADIPVAMLMEVALPADKDFVLARLLIKNNDQDTIRIFETVPLSYTGADPGLAMGTGYSRWRFYRTGYQSWSPAGSIGVMEPDQKPTFFLASRTGMNPRTGYSRRPGEKASDWMAQIVAPEQKLSLLAGFITSAKQLSRVEFQVKYDRFRRLEAIADGDGARLDPAQTLASEWVMISLSDDPLASQENYYQAWGRAMNARKSKPVTGWCSWYYYYWTVSEQKMESNLKELKPLKGLIDMVQLDDGFEEYVGEWVDWNFKFPAPAKSMVDKIHEAGFTAGIWMAPFLISRTSPRYRANPDWVIRNEKGRPIIAFVHPQWKGRVMYALDPTHPQVQAWLHRTVSILLHEFGFDYLKIDFIYSAALPGKRYDQHATGAMALRQGLQAIREAAGEDKIILGCGAPLGPVIGLVDANRVSQDVDIHWDYPLAKRIYGVSIHPSAKNCFQNNLARAMMHKHLWVNDPDCLVLRQAKGGMNLDEIHSELALFYLSGGALLISEDMAGLPPERRSLLYHILPISGEAARPLDLLEKDFPEIFFLRKQETSLLALYNWDKSMRPLTLDLEKLALSGPHHVFDYWAGKYLGIVEGTRDLGHVPGHGCKYLALTKAASQPTLIGLDFHLGMGTLGVERRAARSSSIELKISLPGPRQGRIWVAFPDGKIKEERVSFTDLWEGVVEKK